MYSQEDADRILQRTATILELIHKNIEYPFLLQEYRKRTG